MIDAQLTTEIFGLLAPGALDVALDIAHYSIRTAGYGDAVLVSEFYVITRALAAMEPRGQLSPERINLMPITARQYPPDGSVPEAMFDLVRRQHEASLPCEATRDMIYKRYQVEQ